MITAISHKNLFLTTLFLFAWSITYSQNSIKSIQLKPLEQNNFSTVVPLGKTLQLSFDDLDADQKEYSYKIEHMTYDWQPSNISTNEYIEGFHQNRILNYENSFNTLQNYTHYSIQIPNNNTKIIKSGNYLISVLDEDENIVFSRRITLYENTAIVGVSVLRSRDTKTTDEQQTIQFTVNYNPNQIKNPLQEIKIAILQNNSWNNAITNIQPQFVRKNQLLYKYFNKTNFWAGNEYLNFDNKQIRNSTLQIAKVVKKDIFHSYLYPNERRDKKPYTYFPDINGQFVIRTIEAYNNSTEADYAKVYFTLNSEKLTDKKVFVYGAFNGFETTSENEMSYNSLSNTYKTNLLLKQGFYNYTYATVDTENNLNLHELNGSFYQTENEYTVIVYYKPFGARYERVIGIGSSFFNQQD